MDARQTSKRPRLSSGNVMQKSVKYSRNDDFELWGEELAVDDDIMQEIETQAYSQYYGTDIRSQCSPKVGNEVSASEASNISKIPDDLTNLNIQLQIKTGEAKNLRIEMDNKIKEFHTQLRDKDDIIEDLKKQISSKQSEIEFQKIEKMAQICKTPKSSVTFKSLSKQSNLNANFRERFSFDSPKTLVKETKIFNFGNDLHKGDILYELLQSALSSSNGVESYSHQTKHDTDKRDFFLQNSKSLKNEFEIYLESYLLRLCRYNSFDRLDACELLKLIIIRSKELLLRFHQKISKKEISSEITQRKSKFMTLHKTKDTSSSVSEQDLLKNTKLIDAEKGIHVRQTITMLARLLQVKPKIASMLIESDGVVQSRCRCITDKVSATNDDYNLMSKSTISARTNSLLLEQTKKMDIDHVFSNKDCDSNLSKKTECIFDAIELSHDIIQEIIVREKSRNYGGVFSSVLYLYSALCCCNINLMEKHHSLIVSTIKKILFSLPNFIVVHHIIEFLSSTTNYSFSNSLCCRSAAETFLENFRCFNFTKETCMLQVLCAYVEMMNKSPRFIDKFILWVSRMNAVSHNVKWMRNKTDSKLCECLLMLEQIVVKIMLTCIEYYKDNKKISDRLLLKSSLEHGICIFQQFRWQDADFDLHITTCRGEYKMLLHYLSAIIDNHAIQKFVKQEQKFLSESQKTNLSSTAQNKIIEGMLKLFSEDYF